MKTLIAIALSLVAFSATASEFRDTCIYNYVRPETKPNPALTVLLTRRCECLDRKATDEFKATYVLLNDIAYGRTPQPSKTVFVEFYAPRIARMDVEAKLLGYQCDKEGN